YFTPLAQAIDRLVARQGNEPGQGAGARRIEAICTAPHGGEDLLQDLFGVAWIPQHTQTHAEETPPGVPVKLREGALVALARASQQSRQCVAIVGGSSHRRIVFPGVVCSNSVVSRSSPQAMLREWRQDFARMMREQGIAANATPRSVRGQTKRATKEVFYRTQQRGESYVLREDLDGIVRELSQTQTISDPARRKLVETRRAIIAGWNAVAAKLEAQGEEVLGGDVRYFAKHLPPVMTDRERLAAELIRSAEAKRSERTGREDPVRERKLEMTR